MANTAPDWSGPTIALIGLMGAGKTTVGRRLAARLGLPFFDADAEIETAAGMSVSDIFAERGESDFRRGERRVIERLLEGPTHVLATGGGAFMQDETRALIKQRALSLWLRADLDLLMRRVSRRKTRPLLQTENPRRTMEELMAARYPIYAEADLVVDALDAPHAETVDAAFEALMRRQCRANGGVLQEDPA
ncbi:MAG: shikimate kinase [Pseudomonadota bacterium]